jgi:two-component system, cell cycle sensor histidine kinase and response regulator CckA
MMPDSTSLSSSRPPRPFRPARQNGPSSPRTPARDGGSGVVLLVEDIASHAAFVRGLLAETGWQVVHVDTLAAALARLGIGGIDAVLLDLRLPDSDGLETLQAVCQVAAQLPIVVLTALQDRGLDAEALRLGAEDFLDKSDLERRILVRTLRHAHERKRARWALRESERRFQSLFDNAMDAMVIGDDEGRCLDANPAACRLLRLTRVEVLQRTFMDVTPPEHHEGASAGWARFLARGEAQGNVTLVRGDATRVEVEFTSRAHFVAGQHLSILRDVTERRRLEESLRESQKLEATGRLAGGVAHDFNNLLTVIVGYADILLRGLPEPDPRRRKVTEIRVAADRAAKLTAQLLAFGRRQVLRPEVLDLGAAVVALGPMLQRVLSEDVRLKTVVYPGTAPIKADRHQIEQILVTLAANARDAMPQGGELVIEVRDAEPSESEGAPATPHVVLAVTDTGAGMDPETLRHVFEPFFTTKGHGQGTGLGLATVYGIVEQSGGHISVASAPDQGSTFTVRLPRAETPAPVATPVPATAAPEAARVLLVEDEGALRAMVRDMLESIGCQVTEAASGTEALRVAAGLEGEIDLLLTDVIMPGLSGRDVAERLTGRVRHVLFMSGYTDDDLLRRGVATAGAGFLQKPFSADELLARVRKVLANG